MKNALKLFGILVLMLTAPLTQVHAGSTTPYDITEVEVEGISVLETNGDTTIYVERGETIDIDVFLQGTGTKEIDNVRIEVELGGYDRDLIRDVTDSFIVLPNTTYPGKRLTLELPDDLNTEDTYTLKIRAYDRENSIEWGEDLGTTEGDIILQVTESEHYLKILDVDFDPNLNYAEPGNRLFADVRVENFGYQTEEDIRVVMEIPSLSLSTSSYIDVLESDRDCGVGREGEPEYSRYNDGKCENSETETVSLIIPSNAEGEHKVFVRVEYDDGDEVLEQEYTLFLTKTTTTETPEEPTEPSEEFTVDVDTKTQNVEQGAGVVYKVIITNLGDKAQTYTLNLKGLESWATYSIDPSAITVGSQETEDIFVFVNANEDANKGLHSFVLDVKSSTNTEEVTLTVDVVVEDESQETWKSIKLGLEIGFIVLLVILIILGLILAFRKKGRDNLEEPSVEGEDTYY